MPLPSPNGKQDRKQFMQFCMSDEKMKEEFSESKQRYAVCLSQWNDTKGAIEIDLIEEE